MSDSPPSSTSSEPIVTDDGDSRWLQFGPGYVQSEMSLDDPWRLQLRYTQKMMAFLLFQPRPKHIVIVGLGGGSLTKFCYRHLPRARITTIEIDPRVIALAPQFHVPPDDERHRIIEADACDWFAANEAPIDVVLLDGYTEAGIASGFGQATLYQQIQAQLRPGGLLVANILVTAEAFRRYRRLIGKAFDGRVIVQRIVTDGNNVVFALKALPSATGWADIAARAKKLQASCELDFPAYARSLRRAHEWPALESAGDAGVSML